MTTRLQRDETRFFPFNKGIENPVNPDGHKTAYLWEDILQPDNLMELINNFIHEQETTEKVYDPALGGVRDVKGTVLVFPRYHQLDVIHKLKAAIRSRGCRVQLPDPTHHRERQVKLHRMVSAPADTICTVLQTIQNGSSTQ